MNDLISIVVSSVIQLVVFLLIPFIWWAVTARKTSFFQWIGLKKPKLNISLAKLMTIIFTVSILYIFAMGYIANNLLGLGQTATSQFSGKGLTVLPQILIFAIFQTGLSEEILFRGFLCKRLIGKFGFTLGNTIQAVCFGLIHGIPFGLVTQSIFVLILVTIFPAIMGYTQGWLNEKHGDGSIIPSWILHSLMNILSGLTAALSL
ncbi:MAG: CPBP family intramembrane metalloprotease [Cellulosilyticum sp.]|nr:CPBP family intramembrane metalloprotease [Cellulosilyticum sp.]